MSSKLDRREFLKLSALALGALTLPQIVQRPLRAAASSDAPNIILLLFDTFSARHISTYGYARETTPNISRFAEQSLVYHRHMASAPFTTPSTASLLTGTHAWTHRALGVNQRAARRFGAQNLFLEMARAGYSQIAYTHNPLADVLLRQFGDGLDEHVHLQDLMLTNDWLFGRLFGFDYNTAQHARHRLLINKNDNLPSNSLLLSQLVYPRFVANNEFINERYEHLFPLGLPQISSGNYFNLETFVDWLPGKLAELESPFLSYMHLLPPHDPYKTRMEFVKMFEGDGYQRPSRPEHILTEDKSDEILDEQQRLYDEFIPYVDAEFGRLLNLLEAQGLLENSWVILTSDHGELFERGIGGHSGHVLYDGVIHVPLMMRPPGGTTSKNIDALTSTVDLLPTLLHIAGSSTPGWAEGEMLPHFRSEQERAVFSLVARDNEQFGPLKTATAAILRGNLKLIKTFGYHALGGEELIELYDVVNDPDELENLYSPSDPDARALLAELEEHITKSN